MGLIKSTFLIDHQINTIKNDINTIIATAINLAAQNEWTGEQTFSSGLSLSTASTALMEWDSGNSRYQITTDGNFKLNLTDSTKLAELDIGGNIFNVSYDTTAGKYVFNNLAANLELTSANQIELTTELLKINKADATDYSLDTYFTERAGLEENAMDLYVRYNGINNYTTGLVTGNVHIQNTGYSSYFDNSAGRFYFRKYDFDTENTIGTVADFGTLSANLDSAALSVNSSTVDLHHDANNYLRFSHQSAIGNEETVYDAVFSKVASTINTDIRFENSYGKIEFFTPSDNLVLRLDTVNIEIRERLDIYNGVKLIGYATSSGAVGVGELYVDTATGNLKIRL